jgi:hypothetical protein
VVELVLVNVAVVAEQAVLGKALGFKEGMPQHYQSKQ